eukprot:scaffold463_cov92-Cylindrotheca_fusiformis.AAC.10
MPYSFRLPISANLKVQDTIVEGWKAASTKPRSREVLELLDDQVLPTLPSAKAVASDVGVSVAKINDIIRKEGCFEQQNVDEGTRRNTELISKPWKLPSPFFCAFQRQIKELELVFRRNTLKEAITEKEEEEIWKKIDELGSSRIVKTMKGFYVKTGQVDHDMPS